MSSAMYSFWGLELLSTGSGHIFLSYPSTAAPAAPGREQYSGNSIRFCLNKWFCPKEVTWGRGERWDSNCCQEQLTLHSGKCTFCHTPSLQLFQYVRHHQDISDKRVALATPQFLWVGLWGNFRGGSLISTPRTPVWCSADRPFTGTRQDCAITRQVSLHTLQDSGSCSMWWEPAELTLMKLTLSSLAV